MKKFILLCLILSTFSLKALHLEMMNRVFISNSSIKLSDVCRIITDKSNEFEKIKSIEIMNLSYEEKSKNLTNSALKNILQSKTGNYIEISGGLSVIRWEQTQISEKIISDKAIKFLKKKLLNNADYQFEIKSFPKVFAPLNSYELNFNLIDEKKLTGNVILVGKVFHNGKKVTDFRLLVKVLKYQNICIAKTSIKRGKIISINDLQISNEIINNIKEPFFKIEDVIGRIASKRIAAGNPVSYTNTAIIPDVKRNQQVKVNVKNGSVSLIFEGISKGKGYIGDVIQIENPNSKQKFKAIISNKNEVTICLGEK